MFQLRRSTALVALLVGFVVVLPACGSSSSKSTAEGADSEAAAQESSAESGETGQPSADQCAELAGRWQNLIAGPATAVGGGTEDAASLRSQIDALTNEIPEQIRAAFAVFATSTEKVLELMNGYDDHAHAEGEDHAADEVAAEPVPADIDARLQAVAEVTGSAELTGALAQIEAYFGASCPSA